MKSETVTHDPLTSYDYPDAGERWDDRAIFAAVCRELPPRGRLLDAGCGNGYMSARFAARGFEVTGIDASTSGIAQAKRAYPGVTFQQADLTLLGGLSLGPFDAVACVQTLEHVYDPEALLRALASVLAPGGRLVVTTPYNGYLKFLLLALLGRMTKHLDPLWLGGHIKVFTKATLRDALTKAGFIDVHFRGVGRLPWLWKSMIARATKP